MLCPCQSGQLYMLCCGLLINSHEKPANPEALMRSRYTAYTEANIDYILRTMRGRAAQNFNYQEAKIWAQQAQWAGLKIIDTQINAKQTIGFVEFIASYYWKHTLRHSHERSEFHLLPGEDQALRWFYVEGKKR